MATKTTSDLPTRVKVGFRDYRIEPLSAAAAQSNGFVGETSNPEVFAWIGHHLVYGS